MFFVVLIVVGFVSFFFFSFDCRGSRWTTTFSLMWDHKVRGCVFSLWLGQQTANLNCNLLESLVLKPETLIPKTQKPEDWDRRSSPRAAPKSASKRATLNGPTRGACSRRDGSIHTGISLLTDPQSVTLLCGSAMVACGIE